MIHTYQSIKTVQKLCKCVLTKVRPQVTWPQAAQTLTVQKNLRCTNLYSENLKLHVFLMFLALPYQVTQVARILSYTVRNYLHGLHNSGESMGDSDLADFGPVTLCRKAQANVLVYTTENQYTFD